MNLPSVVDSFLRFTPLFILVVGLVIVYLIRGWLIRFFMDKGLLLAQRFLKEVLKTLGSENPQWALVRVSKHVQVLGIIVACGNRRMAVFLPSTPQLVPGKLVFVQEKDLTRLSGLSLGDGIEAILTLGAVSQGDVLERILSQMEE